MLWKTQLRKMNVQASVGDAVQRAQFWMSTATERDNEMVTKWINGDLKGSFGELNDYMQNRLSKAGTRMEREGVEKGYQAAKTTKSNLDDAMNEQMFKDGHLSFADLASYISKRKGETVAGEKEFIFKETGGQQLDNLTRIFNESQETTRVAQEKDMSTKFDTGMVSYNEYKDFLDKQFNLYDSASARAANINTTRYRITPDYKLQELEQMFRSGAFAVKNSVGGWNQGENITGYMGALEDLRRRYGEGSPEEVKVKTIYTDAQDTLRQFNFSDQLNIKAVGYNDSYKSFKSAELSYNTAVAQYQMNPTPENYAKVQQAYAPYQTAFNDFLAKETDYKNLEREAGNLTKFRPPIVEAKPVPGITDITPIKEPTPPPAAQPGAQPTPQPAPDQTIIAPPVPPPAQTPVQPPPPKTYSVRQVLNMNTLKKLLPQDYYKYGDAYYLWSGAVNEGQNAGAYKRVDRTDTPTFKQILNPAAMKQYSTKDYFTIGTGIYLKEGVAAKPGTTKDVTGWL